MDSSNLLGKKSSLSTLKWVKNGGVFSDYGVGQKIDQWPHVGADACK